MLCELFRLFDISFAFWVCSGWSLFGFASLYWVERFCLCVCVKRTVVAVSKETDSLTERKKGSKKTKQMAKRALLVGCNYPGTKCELHGCANDVRRMRTTLVERFGFDESDILVMLDTDPSTPQPTGANIRSSLNKLINSVQPGDALVFHYSGHGTQVREPRGFLQALYFWNSQL